MDLEGLLTAVAAQPDASLAELQARVPALDGGTVSLGAISQWLKRLSPTRKKTFRAVEADAHAGRPAPHRSHGRRKHQATARFFYHQARGELALLQL